MYRLGIEAILGATRVANKLNINPCIPRDWSGFKMDYRFGTALYKISVENPNGVNRGIKRITLDGMIMPGNLIPLVDDGQPHEIYVLMDAKI
jgi:cyclic beta-1,2-glucan synthetase